jgi:hypothetical protein
MIGKNRQNRHKERWGSKMNIKSILGLGKNASKKKKICARIKTIYHEEYQNAELTDKTISVLNHCHQTKLNLSQIESISLKHEGVYKRFNEYKVKSHNGNIYIGQIKARIKLFTSEDDFEINGHDLSLLEVL